MKIPTVYVVQWPDFGILKVGFSEVNRWKRFVFSGADIVQLYRFQSSTDAYHVESWLQEDARRLLEPAFSGIDETSRNLLGNNGSGWAECYLGSRAETLHLLEVSMARASAQASTQADAQASEAEQWHGRTYGTDGLRTASPTRAIPSFVTRTRAYGLADVDEIQPHPKFAPPKADETRAAHLDRLRRNMEAS